MSQLACSRMLKQCKLGLCFNSSTCSNFQETCRTCEYRCMFVGDGWRSGRVELVVEEAVRVHACLVDQFVDEVQDSSS